MNVAKSKKATLLTVKFFDERADKQIVLRGYWTIESGKAYLRKLDAGGYMQYRTTTDGGFHFGKTFLLVDYR